MQWQATVLAGEARAAISPHLKHSQRFLTLHLHELHELHQLPGDTTSFFPANHEQPGAGQTLAREHPTSELGGVGTRVGRVLARQAEDGRVRASAPSHTEREDGLQPLSERKRTRVHRKCVCCERRIPV